jgi:hypothetical protein
MRRFGFFFPKKTFANNNVTATETETGLDFENMGIEQLLLPENDFINAY